MVESYTGPGPSSLTTGRSTHILKNETSPRSNADESEDLKSDSSSVSSQGSVVSVAEVSQIIILRLVGNLAEATQIL